MSCSFDPGNQVKRACLVDLREAGFIAAMIAHCLAKVKRALTFSEIIIN
jgi:hypothetical protein